MALFRQVLQHPETKKWAYIEHSDETKMVNILGDKEFDTKEEAFEWSKGFRPFSYVWEENRERNELLEEKERLEKKLAQINSDLEK
jgi:hypothetical protein